MRRLRRLFGMMAAAGMIAGCLPARPALPVRQEAKHPFPEEQRFAPDRTPAILKTPFPPSVFPQDQFDRSQKAPLQPIKVGPSSEEPAAPTPPPQVVKREPLAEALQCILDNRHDEAVRHLQAYDPQTQDWFMRLLPALSILTRKKIQDLDTAEVAVLHEQLFTLLAAIRPKTELTISRACFCEWIKGYGDYKPLPEGYGFAAWSSARPGECVQLYVEVRNFASELRQGQFETKLASSVEIRDSKGEVMWSYRFEDAKSAIRSRTQLHDHYNGYAFHIPKNIPPGVYSLIVQVADETNPEMRRVARKTLDLRVAAAPLRAALP